MVKEVEGILKVALSIDVNLPRSHAARFPNRCVVCAESAPDSHVRVITGSIGWWTWLLWWWGTPVSIKAPACKRCAWKLQGLRVLSWLVSIALCFIAWKWVWPSFKLWVPAGVQRWGMMGLGLTCLLPQILYEILYPRPFDVTAWAESVDYEFKSQEYAVDFALLNVDADWVKINGTSLNSPKS
jgi:hypothetical protein